MANRKSKKYSYRSSGSSKRLLFDARGERIKESPLNNKYLRFLLFAVLPYLVINGIIFILVCATPKISVSVGDTNDYVTSDVSFTVKSLLPLKSVTVTQESEEIEYEKSGSTYRCTVTKNGSLSVKAVSINGMSKLKFEDVSILDDTAPNVDEASAVITDGKLSFIIGDTQSGVDFDSIYGIVNDDETIYPESVDKELGLVVMAIPSDTEFIDINFSDMVGNARNGRITVTVEGVQAEQEDDADKYLSDDTEDGIEEYTGE